MRKGDIMNLKFENTDVQNGAIRIVQHKTGALAVYSLTPEVMLAIADYVKNERPESSDRHIFLNSTLPFAPCGLNSTALYYVLSRSIGNARIDPNGRKKGSHAVRHSIATRLMSAGVSYTAIADILEHDGSAKNVTHQYLAIDFERLRGVSLEVGSWDQ